MRAVVAKQPFPSACRFKTAEECVLMRIFIYKIKRFLGLCIISFSVTSWRVRKCNRLVAVLLANPTIQVDF